MYKKLLAHMKKENISLPKAFIANYEESNFHLGRCKKTKKTLIYFFFIYFLLFIYIIKTIN